MIVEASDRRAVRLAVAGLVRAVVVALGIDELAERNRRVVDRHGDAEGRRPDVGRVARRHGHGLVPVRCAGCQRLRGRVDPVARGCVGSCAVVAHPDDLSTADRREVEENVTDAAAGVRHLDRVEDEIARSCGRRRSETVGQHRGVALLAHDVGRVVAKRYRCRRGLPPLPDIRDHVVRRVVRDRVQRRPLLAVGLLHHVDLKPNGVAGGRVDDREGNLNDRLGLILRGQPLRHAVDAVSVADAPFLEVEVVVLPLAPGVTTEVGVVVRRVLVREAIVRCVCVSVVDGEAERVGQTTVRVAMRLVQCRKMDAVPARVELQCHREIVRVVRHAEDGQIDALKTVVIRIRLGRRLVDRHDRRVDREVYRLDRQSPGGTVDLDRAVGRSGNEFACGHTRRISHDRSVERGHEVRRARGEGYGEAALRDRVAVVVDHRCGECRRIAGPERDRRRRELDERGDIRADGDLQRVDIDGRVRRGRIDDRRHVCGPGRRRGEDRREAAVRIGREIRHAEPAARSERRHADVDVGDLRVVAATVLELSGHRRAAVTGGHRVLLRGEREQRRPRGADADLEHARAPRRRTGEEPQNLDLIVGNADTRPPIDEHLGGESPVRDRDRVRVRDDDHAVGRIGRVELRHGERDTVLCIIIPVGHAVVVVAWLDPRVGVVVDLVIRQTHGRPHAIDGDTH